MASRTVGTKDGLNVVVEVNLGSVGRARKKQAERSDRKDSREHPTGIHVVLFYADEPFVSSSFRWGRVYLA